MCAALFVVQLAIEDMAVGGVCNHRAAFVGSTGSGDEARAGIGRGNGGGEEERGGSQGSREDMFCHESNLVVIDFDIADSVDSTFEHQPKIFREASRAESRFGKGASEKSEDGCARMEDVGDGPAGHHDIGSPSAVNREFGVFEGVDREKSEIQPAIPGFIQKDIFFAGTEIGGVDAKKLVKPEPDPFDRFASHDDFDHEWKVCF